MNKKIYKGYELLKALEDEEIEVGTVLIFTSTIDTTNKIEVEVARKPQGLILYRKNTLDGIIPSSWLLNSEIEILEDNTEQIEELDRILKLDNLIPPIDKNTDCSSDDENLPDVDNRFKKIYSGWNYYVIYDTETKVMYSVSDGSENRGILTLLVDTDGKPLLYDDN